MRNGKMYHPGDFDKTKGNNISGDKGNVMVNQGRANPKVAPDANTADNELWVNSNREGGPRFNPKMRGNRRMYRK